MSDEALARLCVRYLAAVKDYLLDARQPGAADSAETRENESWMRVIESKMGIGADEANGFRQQLMATVGAMKLDGREFSWQTDPRIRQALEMQLAEEPQSLEAANLREQARIALAARNDSAAVAALNRVILIANSDARALQDRGLAHLRLGGYQQASDDLSSVLALEPENHLAAYHRGIALCAMQQWSQAIPDLNRGLLLTSPGHSSYVRDAGERLALIRSKDKTNSAEGTDPDGIVGDTDSKSSPPALVSSESVASLSGPAKGSERLDCICTKCFQIYSGKLQLGSELKCTSCGALFTVARFFGKTVEGVDWFAWIAGRKCQNCSCRRSHVLGVKRNEILLPDGKWKFWNWTYRRCENCGSTWVIP